MNVRETNHPLRVWRTTEGLSQQALGKAIGVGASQISMVENGVRGLSLEAAVKLHRLADGAVPLDRLYRTSGASEAVQ